MAMHYKGATKNIKYARYAMRQADRILRNQYHGPAQRDLLWETIQYLKEAMNRVDQESDDAGRQLELAERRDQ